MKSDHPSIRMTSHGNTTHHSMTEHRTTNLINNNNHNIYINTNNKNTDDVRATLEQLCESSYYLDDEEDENENDVMPIMTKSTLTSSSSSSQKNHHEITYSTCSNTNSFVDDHILPPNDHDDPKNQDWIYNPSFEEDSTVILSEHSSTAFSLSEIQVEEEDQEQQLQQQQHQQQYNRTQQQYQDENRYHVIPPVPSISVANNRLLESQSYTKNTTNRRFPRSTSTTTTGTNNKENTMQDASICRSPNTLPATTYSHNPSATNDRAPNSHTLLQTRKLQFHDIMMGKDEEDEHEDVHGNPKTNKQPWIPSHTMIPSTVKASESAIMSSFSKNNTIQQGNETSVSSCFSDNHDSVSNTSRFGTQGRQQRRKQAEIQHPQEQQQQSQSQQSLQLQQQQQQLYHPPSQVDAIEHDSKENRQETVQRPQKTSYQRLSDKNKNKDVHDTPIMELPTTLHTYTKLKEQYLKNEQELRQKLMEADHRAVQLQEQLLLYQNQHPFPNESNFNRGSFHPLPHTHDQTDTENVEREERYKIELLSMERKHQVEMENMRMVAEQIQAEAEKKVQEADQRMMEMKKQLKNYHHQNMRENSEWKKRMENLVEKLCILKDQGLWKMSSSFTGGMDDIIMESLSLGQNRSTIPLEELGVNWKEWISKISHFSTPSSMQLKKKEIPYHLKTNGVESFTQTDASFDDYYSHVDSFSPLGDIVDSNVILRYCENLKLVNAKLVQENSALKLVRDAMEEENLKVVQRGIDLEQVAEDAMKECESLTAKINSLEMERSVDRKEYEQILMENVKLKDESKAIQVEFKNLENEVVVVQERLQLLNEQQNQTHANLQQMKLEKSTLEDTLRQETSQLREADERSSNLTLINVGLEEEMLRLKNINTIMKVKLETQETEVISLKKKINDLSKDKTSLGSTLDQLRIENVALADGRTDAELLCSRLSKDLEVKSELIENQSRSITSLKKTLADLEEEVEQLRRALSSLQKENANLSDMLDNENDAIRQVSVLNEKLVSELENYREQLCTVNAISSNLSHERDELEKTITSILDDPTADEHATLLDKLNMIRNEKKELLSARDEMQYRCECLKLVNTALEKNKAAFVAEVKSITSPLNGQRSSFTTPSESAPTSNYVSTLTPSEENNHALGDAYTKGYITQSEKPQQSSTLISAVRQPMFPPADLSLENEKSSTLISKQNSDGKIMHGHISSTHTSKVPSALSLEKLESRLLRLSLVSQRASAAVKDLHLLDTFPRRIELPIDTGKFSDVSTPVHNQTQDLNWRKEAGVHDVVHSLYQMTPPASKKLGSL